MARDRRPRDDDEDEDDRPRRRPRPAEDDEEEPRPKKKARAVEDDDDEDERPRRKPRVVDEDEEEEEDRPRRKKKFKKKPAGMSKGLLFGLIGGGVALVGLVVLLIVLLSGGSPKSVMEKVIRAGKNSDYGTLYDNMSAKTQQRFADGPKLPGMGGITATDPRERFIETMKAVEKFGGNPFTKEKDATVLSETITGDTATVRIRNANGREESVPFIKENGRWKLSGL